MQKTGSKEVKTETRKKQGISHIRLIRSFQICTFAMYSMNGKPYSHYVVLLCIATLNSKQPCSKRASYRLPLTVTRNKDPYPRQRPLFCDGLPHTNFPNKIFSTKFLQSYMAVSIISQACPTTSMSYADFRSILSIGHVHI